ncbi:MAG: enoyl-CoA hydratase-related protein [Calditrichia bacterium]
METKNIILSIEGNTAIVTINRPNKLNALDAETVTELFHVFKKLKSDEQVLAIILTGSGEKAFVAGADIEAISHHDDISGRIFALRGQKVFRFIEKLEKPVIAAVNGFALGGGCELAMACHIRIASENARFGQPEINLGLIPGYGGTQRLPRLIGKGQALSMLLSGEMITADQALQFGLVKEIVPGTNLMNRAKELAEMFAQKAPIALRYILQAVTEGEDMNLDAGLNLEAELFGNLCGTEDMKEGTAAFLEKRKANFKGK